MLDLPGLPLPDLEPPHPPTTHYVLFPDGVLGQSTATDGVEPVLPEGARFVTQTVYEELRAKMRAAHEARLAELLAVEEEGRRQQYEDLRGAGIPETTARALSGYTGPQTQEQAAG